MRSKKYINIALIEREDITRPEADQFTRATIHGNIDDIMKLKRAMDIDQIAQMPDKSWPKCILVEGAPGVGKSTFASKLCRKWAKKRLLQQYQLVLLLKFQDKSVRAAMNISDLFRYHDPQIQQAAVTEIQDTCGKGVLLLFEGYDELPEELRIESSVFLNVITGRELPEATILITSRPWASEFLHRKYKRHISQHIEILGFTKDNIQSYLESTIPNDPSLLADLKKYISCYPHINSMMYIPLNSAIVVEVYRNSRKNKTLVPKTMTELYASLVRTLLLRYLLDHPVHGKKRWRVRSFSDLPQDVYQQLCELGRIAYEGILHDQQVIFPDLPEDFETLGLMQCAPELYVDEGTAVSYNFLHLTVQEYLAAFHLSQQPVEKQFEHFSEYQENKRQYEYHHEQHHFHMVLQFLCGLKMFNGYPSEVLNTLCVKKSGVDSASVINEVTFDTLHWLFEAHDSKAIAKVLGSSDIQLSRQFRTVTPFDCFVLGYCVSHSNCTWKIDLKDCHIGDEGMEMFMQGAVEEETHCTGGLSEMDLSENDITTDGAVKLCRHYNKLHSESCAPTAHLIPHMPHLKTLYLSDNPNIGRGGAVSLITSLTAIEVLWLDKTGIGVEDCRALSKLLSSSKSLKDLNTANNDLASGAVELIISGLRHNTTLERLYMHDSLFSNFQTNISLASVLRTNRTLVYLNLRQCNIDSKGAWQIANALSANNTLQTLILQNNPIGVEGATAFAEMLLKNKSLKKLDLRDDSIGEEGTQKLIDSLTHNTTVTLYFPKRYKSSISSSGVSTRMRFYSSGDK